ncbi:MAG: hypothetical protein AAGN35_20380 [Bacteroidota bacterium]
MKHLILPLLAALFLSTALTGCINSYANIGIPARQEFVLGEDNPFPYRVKLRNMSNKTVAVRAVHKKSGAITQSFGLAGRGETTLQVDGNEKVCLANAANREVVVRAELSRSVRGMRYQEIDPDGSATD